MLKTIYKKIQMVLIEACISTAQLVKPKPIPVKIRIDNSPSSVRIKSRSKKYTY